MFANLPKMPPSLNPEDGFTRFAGGLNQETPNWSVPNGMVRDALNYEVAVEDGYRDIRGYERFDGQTKPSEASYMIVDITISGTISVGDTVTGAVTGDTGYVIAVDTYDEDPTQYYMVLTKVVGDWDNSTEDVLVSAVVQANVDAVGYADSAPTALKVAQYKNLAADQYRADITVVPGEGDVWGGFSLGDTKYALRNKTGGATAGLYKSTSSGWSEITLNRQLAFTSGGTTELAEGDTITGLTSGCTAVIKRIQVTSGTWAGGDAAGWITLASQSTTFQAENIGNDGASDHATIAGDSAVQTLQPSGRLDYDISNFADPATGADRVYCADGVNKCYEFDGTTFAFIYTGMTVDTPTHVHVHKNHLFLSFGGSVQHSSTSTPFSWSVVTGAGEIATGYTVTGFQVQPGAEGNAALLVACRQRLFVLYGNDITDWNLVRYRRKVGAYEWTIQQLAYTLYLDDRGITDLRTVQAFGNFDHSALSNLIRTLINAKKTLSVASCVVRDKNQYRLFFSDKTAIYVTMDGEAVKGMMPIELGDQVTCAWSEEDSNGNEEIFFGSDDGYVYQMEKGTSFDGDPIYAYIYTHWDNSGILETTKSYFGPVTIECKGAGYAEIDVAYQLDYNRAEVFQPEEQTQVLPLASGPTWDASGFFWDTGLAWDDTSVIPTVNLDLRGEGRNVSWIIAKSSDYFEPVLLSGVHYRYIARVQRRG